MDLMTKSSNEAAIWSMRQLRDLYDLARERDMDRDTRQRLEQIGFKIADYMGRSIMWSQEDETRRWRQISNELERELRRIAPNLPRIQN
jgi:hypothetical protein